MVLQKAGWGAQQEELSPHCGRPRPHGDARGTVLLAAPSLSSAIKSRSLSLIFVVIIIIYLHSSRALTEFGARLGHCHMGILEKT